MFALSSKFVGNRIAGGSNTKGAYCSILPVSNPVLLLLSMVRVTKAESLRLWILPKKAWLMIIGVGLKERGTLHFEKKKIIE